MSGPGGYRLSAGVLVAAVLGLAGCNSGDMEQALWKEVDHLGAQRSDMRSRIAELEKQNEDLRLRVEALSQIGPEARAEALGGLQDVRIGQRSGLFDKDNDGQLETLIVYVRPTDETGDVVKAPGQVRVQLWDLNAPKDQALLGEWTVQPNELKTRWADTFMTHYYRLEFEAAELIRGRQKELTVKTAFTDYVTGRIFRDQMPIRPNP